MAWIEVEISHGFVCPEMSEWMPADHLLLRELNATPGQYILF
jgi:hypothetical protein